MRDRRESWLYRSHLSISAKRHPLQALLVAVCVVLVATAFRSGFNFAEIFSWSYLGFGVLAVAVMWLCFFVVDMIIDACSSARDQA
jgi:hypothetical protein